MSENELGKIIVDCAVLVHKKLGPGLLELVYEVMLSRELKNRGLSIERQVPMPIVYDGIKFGEALMKDDVIRTTNANMN